MSGMSEWTFADIANMMSRQRAEILLGKHDETVQAQYNTADIVFAEWPIRRGRERDKVLLKGVEQLQKIISSGKAEGMMIAVFPVETIAHAAAMSRMYGDGLL